MFSYFSSIVREKKAKIIQINRILFVSRIFHVHTHTHKANCSTPCCSIVILTSTWNDCTNVENWNITGLLNLLKFSHASYKRYDLVYPVYKYFHSDVQLVLRIKTFCVFMDTPTPGSEPLIYTTYLLDQMIKASH